MLFVLRENIFKRLVKKGNIKSDSNQPDITEYKESIGERTKLRRQKLDEIERKEQNINNNLFKKYFAIYQSPSNMYDILNNTKNTEKHNIQVKLIKSSLIDLKKDIGNESKDDVDKIEKINKITDVVELILTFDEQHGEDLKSLTPSQMLSRLPISLAQLKAGNNSEKLQNEIRQLLYSLYRSKKLTKQIYKSLIDII